MAGKRTIRCRGIPWVKAKTMYTDASQFSEREKEVIDLLLQGKSNKQIALALGISARTVEFHLKNVYRKLRVSSRTEAVLKLGKSAGGGVAGTLGETAVAGSRERAENDGKPTTTRRIPMKNLFYILGAALLTTLLVAIFVFSNLHPGSADTAPMDALEMTPTAIVEQSTQTSLPPTATVIPAVSATAAVMPTSAADVAHFVSENYPDGTNVALGATFTKTWTLQNAGTTTWSTTYSFAMTGGAYPLGEPQGYPSVINLPHEVKPGETVEFSANITAPKTDTVFELHYRLKNANGQFISGDGNDVWLKVTVGNAQLPGGSTGPNNVTMKLISMQKQETTTNVEVCAQLPNTLDWNFNGVVLTAGNVQNSPSGWMLVNPKDAGTYSSSYRCYVIEFPVGVGNYGAAAVSVTISNIRVPAEDNLEVNCARAKQQLAPLYPGLDFTCGPVGFFYSNLKLPSGMNKSQADIIIMDALEQAVYGPWVLSE